MRRVLLAVDASTPDLTDDDRVLADALRARGVTTEPVRWGDAVPADAVLAVRSTWDYVERPAEFLAWLDHLDERKVLVANSTATLRWNLHKGYLLELERHGVPIVPTVLIPSGDRRTLDDVRQTHAWDHVVVKPAIAGTARATVHSRVIGHDAAARHLARLVADEDVLVQPVVDSIRADGEVSVLAVGGEPTAAVLKVVARGEWRVQSDFGGTAQAIPLTEDLAAIARGALLAVPDRTAYARVDVAAVDGTWALMELELVEPEMFFRLHPALAEALAEHLARLARP